MNGQAAEDLWHLTIDDLLAAPADGPRLQGPGPFVINLSASTAPIEVPAAGLKGYEQLLLYQLKQTEDGRTRFRLRLGPIASELEADAILSAVREHYPSAFAANAAEDDLKVFERKGARAAEAQRAPRTNGHDAPANTAAAAPPAAPAVAIDAAGEVEAEIELAPAAPAAHAATTAPGKASGAEPTAPAEESAEFAIDFDAFLPPMDLPAQAMTGKRKKRSKHPHPAKAHPVAKAAKPRVAKPAAPPRQPEPTPAQRTEPATFVEPAPDSNAATDQVAVLSVPDTAGELTLDDAVDSMIVPVLSDAPEHDLDMSGMASDDQDLASVVARNNAMVEALEARSDQSAVQTEVAAPAPEPTPAVLTSSVAPAVHETPVSAPPVTAAAVPPTADVLAAIAAAPSIKDLEAVQATAILQVEAAADIEADVDDFTSTIVGVEGEQDIEAMLDEVPTLVPVPSEAVEQLASEPEPPELVEVVEPRRAVRKELPVAPVVERAEPITLTEAVEIPKRAPVAAAPPAIEVSAVEIEQPPATEPVVELTLVPDEPFSPQATSQPPRADSVLAPARTEPTVEAKAPVTKAATVLSDPLPEVDSTQTIRPLTPLELADDQASQYFAIQLSLSDEAVDQDQVPHLDIFDAYRLYCVAGMHQGSFKHALRLGFFSDAASAEAVAGYLRCYFESPQVTRVANAERERFSQQRVVPRRDIGATGMHTVIELSTAARVPERRLADISNNPQHRASDSGSLWSRLVAPLKR